MAQPQSITQAEAEGLLVVKRKDFPYQSFFDGDALESAIRVQPPNQPIVPSTIELASAPKVEQIAGYALGLHCTSECPVAVEFQGAGGSLTYTLVPGQILRPAGGPFSGFRWGLPFGWLGGGLAHLVVFRSKDTKIDWPQARSEVLFHRFLSLVKNSSAGYAAANFPHRFPWTKARRYDTTATAALAQFGSPMFTVVPTRTLLRLSYASSAEGLGVRAIVTRSPFDKLDDGTYDTGEAFADLVFPGNAGLSGAAGSAKPVVELPPALNRLCGDDAQIRFVDMSGGSLVGVGINVLRYGYIA